ncbi:MAG: SpoIID/LytB domain-containing protein [Candidatus Omnitrophota bacterium]|jgi:stage II sporulation protein D
MKILKHFFLVLVIVNNYGLLVTESKAQPQDTIRVAITQDISTLNIKVSGPYEVTNPDTHEVLYQGRNLKTTVTTYKNGILIGEKSFNRDRILIIPKDEGIVIMNDRTFRGSILIIKDKNGLLSAINRIGLEDYIRGILYHEVSHYWPMEVLKAQAIVSRTYARYSMQVNKLQEFDLTNDIYSQVYGGSRSERFRTNQAVEETVGRVITFEGKIIPAYFHATCGGHTEDASLLWNINIPPLKGVACGFCKDSPHFNWHEVIFTGEIRQALVNAGYKIGVIKKIFPLSRDTSGRISDLKIINTKNDLVIPAKDFRNIIGPNLIRSTNFKVNIVGTDAVFEGIGWGHGVGLCQWGAYFMAKNGSSAEEIIRYYYPKTDVQAF